MSAIANITVFDGAGTPVSHTLVAESVSRPSKTAIEATYRETGLAVPTIAQPRLVLSKDITKNRVYVSKRTLEVPVMESISGQNAAGYTAAPRVAHIMKDVRIQYMHERSDVAGRRLVRQMGINLDGSVATSVAAVATGPVPELFDLLVAPT